MNPSPGVNSIFDVLDKTEKETTDDKRITQISELRQSLVELYDGYKLVLKDPEIESFFKEWQAYKSRTMAHVEAYYRAMFGKKSHTDGLQDKTNEELSSRIHNM